MRTIVVYWRLSYKHYILNISIVFSVRPEDTDPYLSSSIYGLHLGHKLKMNKLGSQVFTLFRYNCIIWNIIYSLLQYLLNTGIPSATRPSAKQKMYMWSLIVQCNHWFKWFFSSPLGLKYFCPQGWGGGGWVREEAGAPPPYSQLIYLAVWL